MYLPDDGQRVHGRHQAFAGSHGFFLCRTDRLWQELVANVGCLHIMMTTKCRFWWHFTCICHCFNLFLFFFSQSERQSCRIRVLKSRDRFWFPNLRRKVGICRRRWRFRWWWRWRWREWRRGIGLSAFGTQPVLCQRVGFQDDEDSGDDEARKIKKKWQFCGFSVHYLGLYRPAYTFSTAHPHHARNIQIVKSGRFMESISDFSTNCRVVAWNWTQIEWSQRCRILLGKAFGFTKDMDFEDAFDDSDWLGWAGQSPEKSLAFGDEIEPVWSSCLCSRRLWHLLPALPLAQSVRAWRRHFMKSNWTLLRSKKFAWQRASEAEFDCSRLDILQQHM